jgi:hypothetical protein
MSDRVLDVLSRSSGAVVLGTALVVGAGLVLGVSMNSPQHFLSIREWTQAIGECLRHL